MLNTDKIVSLLVGHECSFRRMRDGQNYGAWVLTKLLSDKYDITELFRFWREFDAPPIGVIQAILLAQEDWSATFKTVDDMFAELCDASEEDRRGVNLVALCHNALLAAMEACVFMIGMTALTPENEKQFFDFLITASFGKYSKVMEFGEYHSGMMSNCSGKIILLRSADNYFATLHARENERMSGCGKQIASDFCIKLFASMPLSSKILICAPEQKTRVRKK